MTMLIVRQNATHKVVVGPAVAVGDGFTPVANLDVATADEAEAIKHDNGTVVDISGYTWAAIATADGYYHLTLHADISGTVGHMTVVINDDSLCLPVRADFQIIEEAVYDAMYAASAAGPLQSTTAGRKLTVESDGVGHADVKEWLGTAPLGLSSQRVHVNVQAIDNSAPAALALGDWLIKGTRMTADSGTTTTLVDAGLTQADDYWNGSLLIFRTGTNSGRTAIVTDFDAASDTITFAPAVPDAVTTEGFALIPGLGWSDVQAISGTAQRAIDLAEIAQYLIANSAEPITNYVADDSLLAKLLAADGDISAYDDQVHSQEAIAVTLAANSGVLYSPDASSVITTGTEDAGTFASTAVDDATWWTIGDSNGTNTIDVVCEFNMGANRQAAELDVVGYFNRNGGGGYVVQVDAWNYTTGAYVTISGGTSNTELRDRSTDKDYVFALASDFTDSVTTPGEVKIRFRSTRGTTQGGDVLSLNYVAIHGLASSALSPEAIASAVWLHDDGEALARHTSKFTGKVWYIDAAASDDEGSGQQPDDAYQKIGTAISGASAGDRMIAKAGTYTETGIDMNLSGLELWGEIGAIIDPASGSALTVSATSCLVNGMEVHPAAGEIGFDLANGSDQCHLVDCRQSTTGGTGLKIDSAVDHVIVDDLNCGDYTSVGIEVNGADCIINRAICHGIGGAETGFKLNHTNAHHNLLFACASIDNATSGYTIVSGADDNVIQVCSASAGCGGTLGRSDAGANNSWRGYMSADTDPADVTKLDGNAFAAQVLARKNYAAHDEAYVVVAEAATDTLRGTALKTAYTAAKALTPGGESISITNRAAVLIPPGRYLLTSTLDLDTEGVDLIALQPERGADRTLDDADVSVGGLTPLAQYRPPCTEIYTTTNSISTVTQSASNVKMRGFAIAHLSTTAASGRHALYVSAASNEGSVYEDMYFWHIKPSNLTMPTGFIQDVRGTWRGCIANAFAYRVGHDVGAAAIFSATMYDCQGGADSFIGDPDAYRTGTTTASGCRLVRCKAIGAYGTTDKELGRRSFSGCLYYGLNVDAACYFEDCAAGIHSFGISYTNAGTYVRCFGEDYCFGATLTDAYPNNFTGMAIDCQGGKGSFGGRKAGVSAKGTLAGTIINCQAEDSELPWRLEGATVEDSLLTVGTNNQDGITLLDSLSRVHNSTILVVEGGTGVPINAASALTVSAAGNRYNNADTTATGLGANVTNQGIDGTLPAALATVAKTGADSDTLEDLSDQLDGLEALSGEGAYTGTLTVDDGEGTDLQGAVVNARRGGVLKASGATDPSGEITNWVFGAYTYEFAVRLAGKQPKTETLAISANGWTKTISLTSLEIDAPPSASTITGVMTVYDEKGVEEESVEVSVQITEGPGTAGIGYDSAVWTETSNGSGVVQLAGLIKGATYKIWRGDSKANAQTFTAPTEGDSFDLTEVIGRR